MEPMVERVAGIDVGQAKVVVTILLGPAHRRPVKRTRSFRTLTQELLEMRAWLVSEGVTHIAMESTGVYWKPVHALVEDAFEVFIGNAHHIKNVPGRKTDVKDSEWLAELMRHGLIAKSFVPPKPIRELRDLVRYRRKLVEARTTDRNRVLRLLELGNIKLASIASDVFGVSGMLMLRALAEGQATPAEMALLAHGRLMEKLEDLRLALDGRMEEHHRFLLRLQLRRLDLLEADIETVEAKIVEALSPYASQCAALHQIPGIHRTTAAILISELGIDMTVFRGPRQLAAWAGVCPGNNESGGKRRPVTVRKGNVYLKTALVEAAIAATRKKGSYFKDKFYRLSARRGRKRAALAIAHKILIAVYHVLSGRPYAELSDSYLDGLDKRRSVHHLVHRLERLGYRVDLQPRVASAFS